MYNLIVGFTGGIATRDRIFEHTDEQVREYFAPQRQLDPFRLVGLPTLLMPEIGDHDSPQVAQVGHIEHVALAERELRFQFVPSATIPAIHTGSIEALAGALGIARFEFNRTHWAVKNVDLYRVLLDYTAKPPAPKVFRFPTEPQASDLVAIMMPFDAGFTPVYDALRQAVADAGLRSERADDIWVNDAIMEDIASLIWRSRVVISDLTGKNANVFYETGIAHTLGRDVIQITQSPEDVPFDLRHLRYVRYLSNREGLGELSAQVTGRLTALVARA